MLQRAWDYGESLEGEGTDMDYFKARVTKLLVGYFGNDYRRINHALEVLRYAEKIRDDGQECDDELLIASALLHDIGIKRSEELHGYNNGATQEEYGPPVARELLREIGFPADKTETVCRIIGNHHSPSRHGYAELKILKEADRIVNRMEGD
jgi:putative nucleotidyltransferase with HDIG domain